MRTSITKEQIIAAIEKLEAAQQKPTILAIRTILGTGSLSTIVALKREIEAEKPAEPSFPRAASSLQRLTAILAEAREEGRQSRDAEIAEARAALDQVTAENERLETQRLHDQTALSQATQSISELTKLLARLEVKTARQPVSPRPPKPAAATPPAPRSHAPSPDAGQTPERRKPRTTGGTKSPRPRE